MAVSNSDQDDFDPSLDEAGDDFSYEEESFGDEEFSEEESWDENAEDEGGDSTADEAPAKPIQKKGGLFNILLIGAALIGGGAFIYLKVLSAPSGAPSPAITAETAATPEPVQQAQVDTTPVPEPVAEQLAAPVQNAFEVNPLLPTPDDVADQAETPVVNEPDLSGDSALSSPVTEQQPVEVSSAPPMPAPIGTPEIPPAPQGQAPFVAALPSARDIMIANPALSQEEAVVQVAPEGLSAEQTKGIEQKLSILITRLDTFEGRIANLENGLHQMSAQVGELGEAPEAPVDLSAVNKALQSLEEKVSLLESGAAKKAPSSSPTEQPTFVPAPEMGEEKEKPFDPKPQDVKASVEDSSPKAGAASVTVEASKPVSPVTAIPNKVPPAPVKDVAWVLRSAQPGSAMVAPKSGGDMRSVSVGDTLSGLGRIVSIEQQGNRWVVKGTQGILTH